MDSGLAVKISPAAVRRGGEIIMLREDSFGPGQWNWSDRLQVPNGAIVCVMKRFIE